MEDKTIVEKRVTFGPGVRHAIVWLSIISSFWGGWYTKGKVIDGELAAAAYSVLKDDVENKEDNRILKLKDSNKLDKDREGRVYDETCGNMSLSDFSK